MRGWMKTKSSFRRSVFCVEPVKYLSKGMLLKMGTPDRLFDSSFRIKPPSRMVASFFTITVVFNCCCVRVGYSLPLIVVVPERSLLLC